jgi:hypothetical protein
MHMKHAWLVVTLGLVAGCGGATPPPATTPAEPAAESFGPGIVAHESTVEALSKEAQRLLAASYTVAPGDTPGMVATTWADHDARRWPGAQTRVLVEITAAKVIVRLECRAGAESCARTMPEDVQLVVRAQELAHDIAWGNDADVFIAKVRELKDQMCACRDHACVERLERETMEWVMKNMDRMSKLDPTPAQDAALDRIEDDMERCREKVAPAEPIITRTPPSAGSTGSPECDDYLKTFDRVVDRCAHKLGPALDAMKQSRDAQAAAFAEWATLDDASFEATIEAAASGCKAANDAVRQSAKSMGCKL